MRRGGVGGGSDTFSLLSLTYYHHLNVSDTFHFICTSLQVNYNGLAGQRIIAHLLLSDDMLLMYTAGQLTMGQLIRIFHIANTYNLPVERRNTTCIQITYFGCPRAAEYI